VSEAAVTETAAPTLAERLRAGELRALARSISLVERRDPSVPELLAEAGEGRPEKLRVGLTGAPGAGKSTLVDALVRRAREADKTVGVIAVDPSSPFTGGALLGDRVRMHSHALDEGVFVRSMGARGHTGGLSATTGEALQLLSAFGFDELLVETVGAGQSEFAVTQLVDTTVLVLTPGMGDVIQLQKAGIMEIADVYVVNKSDQEGAAILLRDLRRVVGRPGPDGWAPPVLGTVAHEPHDSQLKLWEAIERHRAHLLSSEEGGRRLRERLRGEAASMVAEVARREALAELERDTELSEELDRTRSPGQIAAALINRNQERGRE
jgi:LAO/AO transport system kinase